MNTNSELERIVHDWLDVRVVDPPHGSLASALEKADSTSQQRHRWLHWFLDRGRGASVDAPDLGRQDRGRDHRFRLIFGATVVAMGVAAIALVATIGTRLDTTQPMVPAMNGVTHIVGSDGGDFATIGAAVAAAEEGDVVLVQPGIYEEALIIDKAITLKGDVVPPREVVLTMPEDAPDPVVPLAPTDARANAPGLPEHVPVGIQLIDTDALVQDVVVIGRGDGIAILVHGGAPTLERVKLKHTNSPFMQTRLAGGLFVEGESAAMVYEAEIWYRVRVSGSSAPVIRDSVLSAAGIAIQDGAAPVFIDNIVSGDCGCRDAAVLGGAYPTFRGNSFSYVGLDIIGAEGDGTGALLEDNRFSGHEEHAITVDGTATVTALGNRFYGNQQALRVTSAGAEIRDNEFVGNWHTVQLTDTDATFADNTIRGGDYGISVTSSGSPVITGNLIENARVSGVFAGNGTSPSIVANEICGSSNNLLVAADAAPSIGENEVCPDLAVAD